MVEKFNCTSLWWALVSQVWMSWNFAGFLIDSLAGRDPSVSSTTLSVNYLPFPPAQFGSFTLSVVFLTLELYTIWTTKYWPWDIDDVVIGRPNLQHCFYFISLPDLTWLLRFNHTLSATVYFLQRNRFLFFNRFLLLTMFIFNRRKSNLITYIQGIHIKMRDSP